MLNFRVLAKKVMWNRSFATPLAPRYGRYRVMGAKPLNALRPKLIFVPISVEVRREGEPSANWLVTMQVPGTSQALANFYTGGPNPQYLSRAVIYREVMAQAYEYSEPRLGMTRWPTLSETANHLLFNLTEGSENTVPTVDGRIKAQATVDGEWSSRETVVIEKMADGQWRVAGSGYTNPNDLADIPLKVTTSGRVYAFATDDYGVRFVPGLDVEVGQRIRPTQYAGWLYEITEAGQLPQAEPAWWPAEGDNVSRVLGTSLAKAVRYFRPLAHGPVPVELD